MERIRPFFEPFPGPPNETGPRAAFGETQASRGLAGERTREKLALHFSIDNDLTPEMRRLLDKLGHKLEGL